jgi:hypothetical protein
MSLQVIHSTAQKARKTYHDDGWEFISEWISGGCYVGTFRRPQKITFGEARILVGYKKDNKRAYKILPGDMYQRQFNSCDGDTFTFRMKQDLFTMACKYDLFPEI